MNNKSINNYFEKLENGKTILSEKILYDICRNSDYELRLRLAQVLVNYETELSEEVLMHLTDDENELVRLNACDSLCWSKSKDVLEKLILILKNDKYLVRTYAMYSIADIILNNGYNEYISEIKKIMPLEKSKFVLQVYYSFLYRLGDRSYLFKVVENLNSKLYTNRCNTVNLLYNIVRQEDYPVVISFLKRRLVVEETYAVQSAIKKVLSEMQSREIFFKNL